LETLGNEFYDTLCVRYSRGNGATGADKKRAAISMNFIVGSSRFLVGDFGQIIEFRQPGG
jgi:hypothetical protein